MGEAVSAERPTTAKWTSWEYSVRLAQPSENGERPGQPVDCLLSFGRGNGVAHANPKSTRGLQSMYLPASTLSESAAKFGYQFACSPI